jgi:hypothetical protein
MKPPQLNDLALFIDRLADVGSDSDDGANSPSDLSDVM